MASVTDDPKKAIEYVLLFLPGFIALGTLIYLTDLALSEFTFAYIAIALSILINLIADGLEILLTRVRMNKEQLRRTETTTAPYAARLRRWRRRASASRTVLVFAITLLVGVSLALAYESDKLIGYAHSLMPSQLLKISKKSPLVGILAADRDGLIHDSIDERSAGFRLATADSEVTDAGGKPIKVIAPYQTYVRVYLDAKHVYEGRVKRFELEKGKDGLPIVLSPACRIEAAATPNAERIGRIYGPGVLITGKDLKAIELYERDASPCWRCFAPGKTPDSRCYDIIPAAAN